MGPRSQGLGHGSLADRVVQVHLGSRSNHSTEALLKGDFEVHFDYIARVVGKRGLDLHEINSWQSTI
jgi:hypothetical protein